MTPEKIIVFTIVLIAAAAVVYALYRCGKAADELDEMSRRSGK